MYIDVYVFYNEIYQNVQKRKNSILEIEKRGIYRKMRKISQSLLSLTSLSLLSSAAMFGINTTSVKAAEVTNPTTTTSSSSDVSDSKSDDSKSDTATKTNKVDTEKSEENAGSTIEVVGNQTKKGDLVSQTTSEVSKADTSEDDKKSEELKKEKEDEKGQTKKTLIEAADYQIIKDNTENQQFEKIISGIVVDVEKKNKEEIHDMATQIALKNPVKTENVSDDSTSSTSDNNLDKEEDSTKTEDAKLNQKIKSSEKNPSLLSNTELLKVAKQVKEEKAKKINEEMVKLGEKNGEAEYLYGNYLIRTSGFKTNGDSKQNVSVKFRLLSMIEKQLYEITNSTELLDSYNKLSNSEPTQEYQKEFTVGMVDVSAPQITLSDKSTELVVGDDFKISDYVKEVVDDEDGTLEYKTIGDVDTSQTGTYNVVVQAKDSLGNVNEKGITFTVVKDLQKTFYNKIAEAAIAQIGVEQDCTMLVTNSLKAVGINFHGWPIEYKTLGEWTDTPVPGDIIIYEGHVALYIGNGRAIHGGWYGHSTVEWSVGCTNQIIGYVHVTPPAEYL